MAQNWYRKGIYQNSYPVERLLHPPKADARKGLGVLRQLVPLEAERRIHCGGESLALR